MRSRRTVESVQEDLKKLREQHPGTYYKQSARLLAELRELQKKRRRYAIM